MSRLTLAILGCVVLAGCLGGPGADPAPGEPSDVTPSATGTVTPEDVSVEYRLRAGAIAEAVAHVYVDFAVYLAERPEDVYACTDDAPLMDNRYDATPTPLPTPAGQCERFDVPRVDLAAMNGSRTLGPFEASGTYAGGHTLVVHDVTVVLENGSTAEDVYDTDFRAVTEQTRPSGPYGVEIGVTDHRDSDQDLRWRFGVDVERFDPEG
jgi:hypothetical protein